MFPALKTPPAALVAPETLAVYVHWPFCLFKCPYCDFNSHVRDRVNHGAWRDAFVRELSHYRDLSGPRRIESVFFGGGTPSLMEPATAGLVIDTIASLWDMPQGVEITLEANPTSVEREKLRDFKSAGVNRVSVGVQAMNDADLKKLGRQHSAQEAMQAVDAAAAIFDRYSFDLIYARSGQTPEAWRAELGEALKRARSHLSLYQLTIEEGTQFHTLHARGDLTVPDQDTAAAMYEITQELTQAAGLPAYEISNHARFGDESRHNLAYWRYRDYAGIGPGAHGRLTVGGVKNATRAHRAPEAWQERVAVRGHGAHPFEPITQAQQAREMLMMGLRLTEGVDLSDFTAQTGAEFSGFVNSERVTIMEAEGLLRVRDGKICATAAGRQRLNAVLAYLLA